MATLTADEKLARGVLPSKEDLEMAYNSPDSILSKELNESILLADIDRAFRIDMTIACLRADQIQRKSVERAEEKFSIEEAEKRKQIQAQAAAATQAEIEAQQEKSTPEKLEEKKQETLRVLREELKELISVSKEEFQTWDLEKLEDHHQKIMNNIQKQVIAEIGPTIEVNGKVFQVPQTLPPAPVGAGQVVKVNPGLQEELVEDPQKKEDFHAFHAKQKGIVMAINLGKEVFDEEANRSGIEDKDYSPIVKKIGSKISIVKKDQTIENYIAEMDRVGIEKALQQAKTLAKSSTFFGNTEKQETLTTSTVSTVKKNGGM